MKHRFLWALWLAGLGLGAGPPADPPRPVTYTDVTQQAGVRFTHTFGDHEMSSILEATGSGCLFFDYDGDGWMDLYAVNGCYLEGISDPPEGGPPPEPAVDHLFRNNRDGTFTDVTGTSGVGDPGYGMGCTAGDYDNDGDQDLYVTNYGRNTLFRNNGDGTFADVTAAAGVGDSLWGVGATFLDYDRDGDLDLYVGNYLEFDPGYRLSYIGDGHPGPLSYPGQRDALYRNEGNGTFTDVTVAAGVLNEGRAMGVVAADYDGDGWPDICVANDAMADFLYHNNGNGTFTDVAVEAGTAFSANGDASSSMGGDFGDFDLDGDPDLFVPDMGFNNLYVNRGDGSFADSTAEAGIAEVSGQYISWHGDFLDYDNDGDLDLFITNGDANHITLTEEALLLANVPTESGGRRYADVSGASGPFFKYRAISRGGAAGDYDSDGDQDLFVLNIDQPSVLLRNDGGNARHWLLIHLRGTRSNRDGIGAQVRVRAGEQVQGTERMAAAGYLSQNDPRLHFGLGQADRVDTVEVRWPSGTVQVLAGVAADQAIEIVEPAP